MEEKPLKPGLSCQQLWGKNESSPTKEMPAPGLGTFQLVPLPYTALSGASLSEGGCVGVKLDSHNFSPVPPLCCT